MRLRAIALLVLAWVPCLNRLLIAGSALDLSIPSDSLLVSRAPGLVGSNSSCRTRVILNPCLIVSGALDLRTLKGDKTITDRLRLALYPVFGAPPPSLLGRFSGTSVRFQSSP